MKTFKSYLLETAMTLDTAMKLFNITQSFSSEDELRTAYKKLAMLNHPDLGGSTEKMKELNQAKDILSKYIGKITTKGFSDDEYNKSQEEYKNLKIAINNLLLSKFNANAFCTYFEKIFGVHFTSEVETSKVGTYYGNMNSSLTAKFFDKEKDIVFELYFGVNLIDIKHNKGLGGAGNMDFTILVDTNAYVHGKKQKISKTSYDWKNDHSMFVNPDITFPKAKMTKIANGQVRKDSKLRKSDFDNFFEKKYGAKRDTYGSVTRYYIPINDNIELLIMRSVIMRQAVYSVMHIAGGTKTKFGFKSEWEENSIGYKYYEENQESMDFFKKLIDTLKQSHDHKSTFRTLVN